MLISTRFPAEQLNLRFYEDIVLTNRNHGRISFHRAIVVAASLDHEFKIGWERWSKTARGEQHLAESFGLDDRRSCHVV
jgi:hypothetical protein